MPLTLLRNLTASRSLRTLAAVSLLVLCVLPAVGVRGQDEPIPPARPVDEVFPEGESVPVLKKPTIPTNLFETIIAGGPLMIPIGICSLVTVAYGIERLVILRRSRVIPQDFVKRFLEHLEQGKVDRRGALELCVEDGSPIADVFAHGIRKWGKPSVEVEQAIIDGGERQVSQLRRHLRILNAVSTLSPLLGLLGTVVGMIMCFNQIAETSAMGKSEQLAGGIGVALITTAGGLGVAIPALILYLFFVGKVDSLVMEMDLLGQRVVDLICAEALAAGTGAGSVKPTKAKAESGREKDKELKKSVV